MIRKNKNNMGGLNDKGLNFADFDILKEYHKNRRYLS